MGFLFLIFNRLDTTKQVFKAIRQAKPPRLYIAADGARANKKGEYENIQAVRNYVMQNADWNCDIKTLFRDQNLGCKYAVGEAITWFFENEEQGIILEDGRDAAEHSPLIRSLSQSDEQILVFVPEQIRDECEALVRSKTKPSQSSLAMFDSADS